MKKFALPIGVLAIIIAGALFFMNQQEEVIPAADNEIVVSDTQAEDSKVSQVSSEKKQTNVKSAKVDSDEVNEKKELDNKKVIVDTITGENIPEGFYDEVLEDDYTYNNPNPFDISLVIPNENSNIPGYITEKQIADFSESWIVPNYPSEEYTGDFMTKYTLGTNYHEINISFPYGSDLSKMEGKENFTKWFKSNYGYDFVFVRDKNYSSNSRLNKFGAWGILLTNSTIKEAKELTYNLENSSTAYASNSKYRLPKYRGTELEKIAREKRQEFIEMTVN